MPIHILSASVVVALIQAPNVAPWVADWALGFPMVVANTIFHAYALGLLYKVSTSMLNKTAQIPAQHSLSVLVVPGTAVCVALLHALEIMTWAMAYRVLGALSDQESAMLYSLNAMTSYGHEDFHLDPRWEMMGALEALTGWILFGLTTALVFGVVQKAWLRNSRSAKNC